PQRLERLADRLASLDRTRQTLGYRETLRRGYAVVPAGERIVTSRAEAAVAGPLDIEFHDGALAAPPLQVASLAPPAAQARPTTSSSKAKKPPPDQGSLF
ncbi:MAG: exodeoxyribonuclease VII large subunit, partial [Paracoccaceae bacterium]